MSMTKQLREMSKMICKLNDVGHILTDEQVQVVIQFLPITWEHMKVQMTHNENIITFDDIFHHLKLEEECLEASKTKEDAFVTKIFKTCALFFIEEKRFLFLG